MKPLDRDALAADHVHLVDQAVAATRRRLCGYGETAEMRACALEGLAEAIARYDPDRGVPFSAFARPRVQGAIYDGLARSGPLPRGLARQVRFYRTAEDVLDETRGAPAPEDTVETVHRLGDRLRELAAVYVTNLAGDEPPAATRDPERVELASDERVALKQHCERLRLHLGTLPAHQRRVLEGRFFEDRPLGEIAREAGRHKSWATRTLRAGIRHLRECFEEDL